MANLHWFPPLSPQISMSSKGPPNPPFCVIKRPLSILIKTEHKVVSRQTLLFPRHSILGVASEFFRAGWTVQRGSGYQSPQGEGKMLPVKFMVHGVHQW